MNTKLLSSVRLAAVAGLAALAAAGGAFAQETAQPAAPSAAELVRLEDSKLDEVWVRAGGADLSRFNAVYLVPVAITYKDRRPDVELEDDQIARMDEIMREEIAAALSGGFAVADAPGPGVLEIRAELADLDINASNIDDRPGVRTFVRNVGSMTLIALLRDSETGENLVLVRDHVQGRDLRLSIVTQSTYRGEFRDAIADWSELLRVRLDAARLAETGSF